MHSGASSLEAEDYLFWDVLEVIIPGGAGRTKPGGCQLEQTDSRAEVPSSAPLSEARKTLLGESSHFLVIYISGLRNKNFNSEKKYEASKVLWHHLQTKGTGEFSTEARRRWVVRGAPVTQQVSLGALVSGKKEKVLSKSSEISLALRQHSQE